MFLFLCHLVVHSEFLIIGFFVITGKSEHNSGVDPLFARFSMLKIGDLYRQQIRVHAWRFWNGRLPANQAAMLSRVGDVHGHATRSARVGMHVGTRDHRSVGYRVPVEWAGMAGELREVGSLAAFKKRSRAGFLGGYGMFACMLSECAVCGGPGV